MSKITQVVAQPFGSTASAGQVGQFGSKAAGSPATTTNPTTMQSLSQWQAGWNAAVIAGNSPCIQDMNAFCFVVMYILTYLQQAGVSEWNAGITYYTGSMVNVGGLIYTSLVDNNTNNQVSNPSFWTTYGSKSRIVTGADTISTTDSLLFCNPSAGSFNETLPLASTCPANFTVKIKNVSTSGNTVTLLTTGTDTIDGMASIVLNGTTNAGSNVLDSVTLVAVSGTGWYIF